MKLSVTQIIETISDTYCSLTPACKAELQAVSKIQVLNKGALVVKEGQLADTAYFVVQGSARAFYLKDGKDITDWFAFENDFISSINSFFLDVPSPHYIEAMEPAVFLQLSRKHISALSDKYHDFERLTKTIVTKTMLQLQQRITSVQFESAGQKYENLLKVRPDITQRMPLTHIASYLGITLETLSRIRNPKKGI